MMYSLSEIRLRNTLWLFEAFRQQVAPGNVVMRTPAFDSTRNTVTIKTALKVDAQGKAQDHGVAPSPRLQRRRLGRAQTGFQPHRAQSENRCAVRAALISGLGRFFQTLNCYELNSY